MRNEYDFSKGTRGPVVRSRAAKTRITIRIDEDILQWFRDRADEAGGGSYQAMINSALRAHIAQENEPLEETFRRVIREEMPMIVRDGGARK